MRRFVRFHSDTGSEEVSGTGRVDIDPFSGATILDGEVVVIHDVMWMDPPHDPDDRSDTWRAFPEEIMEAWSEPTEDAPGLFGDGQG